MSLMKQRFTLPVAVFVLVRNDSGQLLFQRRLNTGHRDGQLGLPAGHKEKGESVTQAAIREAAEEIGITIAPQDLTLQLIMHRKGEDTYEMMDFYFSVENWSGTIQNCEPEKCSELVWIDTADPSNPLPTDVIDYVRFALTSIEHQKRFAQLGWE